MSYELRAGESLGDGVRRVCRDQIQAAIEASKSAPTRDVSAVHGTRRHLKKARAALRLMSCHVRRKDFKREHRRLRNVGRLISEVRDAEVRLGTVQRLRETAITREDQTLQQTEDILSLELDSFFAAFSDWKEEAGEKLTNIRRRMARWHLRELDCKEIRCAVQKTYRNGRRALRDARATPTDENFHEFRKEVKELAAHLRVLRPLDRPTFREFTDDLKTLGEHLGHANDLAFLETRLALLDSGAGEEGMRKLREVIESRREELQRSATVLGRKFYAKRPKDFARRIAKYFERWQDPRRTASANGRRDQPLHAHNVR